MASKAMVVKAAADPWQWLMFYATNFIFPERLGSRSYTETERSRIHKDISSLYDALAEASFYPKLHGDLYENLFGSEDDWEKTKSPEGKRKHLLPNKIYEVSFDEDARSGMLWMFTVLLTPPSRTPDPNDKSKFALSHPYLIGPHLASRVVWPMVRQLGKEVYMRRALGWPEHPPCNWEDESPRYSLTTDTGGDKR
jgi:hypothetical protein